MASKVNLKFCHTHKNISRQENEVNFKNIIINNNNVKSLEISEAEKPLPIKLYESEKRWNFTFKDVIWSNVILITIFHIVAFYAFLTFPYIQSRKTFLWSKY